MNNMLPILVLSWGNPSRGDDALGPLFTQALAALNWPHVECLTDFQLQIEHVLDLRGRECVLLVDAACDAQTDDDAPPFQLSRVQPQRDHSHTTHAMSPAALLQVFVDVEGHPPPPTWLLALRGHQWALGDPLSPSAQDGLNAALVWVQEWLREGQMPCGLGLNEAGVGGMSRFSGYSQA